MRTLFLWFYCLPISNAILLILLSTAIFLFLREIQGNIPYWKCGLFILFFFWITVILLGTLGQRTAGSNLPDPVLIPFYSYYSARNGGSQELYRANFMNTILFYPAGLLGCELLPKRWQSVWKAILVTFIFTLMSIGIEFTQYHFSLGLAETDDVIHNALGTFLGGIACGFSIRFHKK